MIKFLLTSTSAGPWKMQELSHSMIFIFGKKKFPLKGCLVLPTLFLMNYLITGLET